MNVVGIKELQQKAARLEEMTMAELLDRKEGMEDVLQEAGFFCLGCPSAQFETLRDACEIHGLQVEEVVKKVEAFLHE